ncbi:Tetratricopeptide repeat-containing protein [Pseudonocardia ammonioxydans]|uniref:Tetratricopeptide repeat-containing protein n=1 Tax=Pseudonocardia ammonioxydans TaxID=260086 RepID=A0A1I5HBB8_PSUAM|nr:tetratricopeptide repeat protein [Pseudonocardia ammonioxydans]SFO45497.1 Tetratricopeptide repeat-containing protein [Pseudonocardia ammonioxydans]
MSSSRNQEVADQALSDIVELETQVAGGEIGADRARELRRRYETLAAQALAAAESPAPPTARSPTDRSPRAWTLAYVLAATIGLVAAVVLLPAAVVDRPVGGAATGIEPMGAGPDAPPPIDPGAVDDEQLEQVVADNPEVIGMRLALADRYVAAGDYGAAMRHYVEALNRRPDDPDVRTRLAWLLLQIGQTGPALENADRALALQPDSADAAWVRANVLIDGTDDLRGGIAVLEDLATRSDLPPEFRSRVDELLAATRAAAGGPR